MIAQELGFRKFATTTLVLWPIS